MGAILEQILFQKEIGVEKNKEEITIVVSLVKMVENLSSVSINLDFQYLLICLKNFTDWQTVQRLIKLLAKMQFDLGLHCWHICPSL